VNSEKEEIHYITYDKPIGTHFMNDAMKSALNQVGAISSSLALRSPDGSLVSVECCDAKVDMTPCVEPVSPFQDFCNWAQDLSVQFQIHIAEPISNMVCSIAQALRIAFSTKPIRSRKSPQTKHFLVVTQKKSSFTPAIHRRKINMRRAAVYDRKYLMELDA